MSRRAARFTEADLARAIRTAQKCGAGPIEIKSDGTICITPFRQSTASDETPVEPPAKVVL
jgi:hypothetical protein